MPMERAPRRGAQPHLRDRLRWMDYPKASRCPLRCPTRPVGQRRGRAGSTSERCVFHSPGVGGALAPTTPGEDDRKIPSTPRGVARNGGSSEGATPCRGRIYKAYIRRPGVIGTSCLDTRAMKKAPLSGCTPGLRCLALSGSVGMVALDLRCPTRPTRPTRPIGMSPLPLSLCLLFLLSTSLIAFITQGLHMFHFLSHYCRRSHFRSAFSRLGVILLDSVLY